MASMRKYASGGRYIKLEELLNNKPFRDQIAVVKVEDGKFGERVVLVFEGGRELSLNKTSVGNLMRDLGEDDADWIGKHVEVYAGEVETKSGKMDAVLARAATAPSSATKPAPREMDDEIPF
jgi:hypothetical protein